MPNTYTAENIRTNEKLVGVYKTLRKETLILLQALEQIKDAAPAVTLEQKQTLSSLEKNIITLASQLANLKKQIAKLKETDKITLNLIREANTCTNTIEQLKQTYKTYEKACGKEGLLADITNKHNPANIPDATDLAHDIYQKVITEELLTLSSVFELKKEELRLSPDFKKFNAPSGSTDIREPRSIANLKAMSPAWERAEDTLNKLHQSISELTNSFEKLTNQISKLEDEDEIIPALIEANKCVNAIKAFKQTYENEWGLRELEERSKFRPMEEVQKSERENKRKKIMEDANKNLKALLEKKAFAEPHEDVRLHVSSSPSISQFRGATFHHSSQQDAEVKRDLTNHKDFQKATIDICQSYLNERTTDKTANRVISTYSETRQQAATRLIEDLKKTTEHVQVIDLINTYLANNKRDTPKHIDLGSLHQRLQEHVDLVRSLQPKQGLRSGT
jgi:hypothetical protein